MVIPASSDRGADVRPLGDPGRPCAGRKLPSGGGTSSHMSSAVVGHLPQLSEARFRGEGIADEDQLRGPLGAQQAQGVADCAGGADDRDRALRQCKAVLGAGRLHATNRGPRR